MAAAVCVCICVCVWVRMTEDCIHYAEWDVYKTPFSHTHKHKRTRLPSPPLHSLPGFVRMIAALLSLIHLFYLWWQSCLINWILNKPRQKTSPHNFFYLSVHVRESVCVRMCVLSLHCICVCGFYASVILTPHFLISPHKCVLVSVYNSMHLCPVPPTTACDCACVLGTWQKYFESRPKQSSCVSLYKPNEKLGYSAQTWHFLSLSVEPGS